MRASDKKWISDVLLPAFGLRTLKVGVDRSKKGTYPDIWCLPGEATIMVTEEWERQPLHERRKRLTHEAIHLAWGLGHGARERRMGYYSHPSKDTFSKRIYEERLRQHGA